MAREMKDSGIEWIGEIPMEWNIKRLKNLSVVIRGGSPRPIENYLSPDDTGYNWIRIGDSKKGSKYIDSTERKIIPDGLKKSRFVKKGSLILSNSMSFGQPYILKIDGCIHDGWVALSDIAIYKEFMYYFLISESARCQFQYQVAGGVVQNLNIDKIGSTFLPVPDYKVQQSIADFLDTQCTHIDSVIEKTRAAIEEYKKLKQAVITQAVTKGIRPNRVMNDSGIEWFPIIPMEWTVSRVGLHYDIILGKMLCQNQLNNDYTLEPYYCAANVHFDGVSNKDLKQMWFSTAEKEQYLVKEGDLLVVEGGAGAGGSAIVVSVDKPTYIQNSVMIVRPKDTSNNCYLKYLLEFLVKEGYIDVACNKATIPHFTKDKLANVPYLVSSEQSEIVAYLDEKTAAIDSLIQRKEQLITELEAYKKSLIYEYVTGKKEVV